MPEVFVLLCKELRDRGLLRDSRKKVTVERQVLQFMRFTCLESFRTVGDRFQCSTFTVHVYFEKVLDALVALAATEIKLPDPDVVLPER